MIQKRLWVLGLGMALTFALYTALRYHSPALVAYIVEHALIQKSPAGSDAERIRERFHSLLADYPSPYARLEKLLALSQSLEKVQKLNDLELEQLLRKEAGPRHH
jgi:hypothetical protein